MHNTMHNTLRCPVCHGMCSPLDAVDFNKSCEEARGKFLEPAGIPVEYVLCQRCGFCHAPEIAAWPLEEFERKIYNDAYVVVDPDYLETRPRNNAATLTSMFGQAAHTIRHLDYGGGNGMLSRLLNEANWQSVSYDPFVDRDTQPGSLGTFQLITAFEVFEHVPEVQQLMANLHSLLAADGMILFSTLVSDGNIHPGQKPAWWYASPRNGHISLFSRNSLAILAQQRGWNFGSFSAGFHLFHADMPRWAGHLFSPG